MSTPSPRTPFRSSPHLEFMALRAVTRCFWFSLVATRRRAENEKPGVSPRSPLSWSGSAGIDRLDVDRILKVEPFGQG